MKKSVLARGKPKKVMLPEAGYSMPLASTKMHNKEDFYAAVSITRKIWTINIIKKKTNYIMCIRKGK